MLFKVLIQVNVYVKFTIIWQSLISKYENILFYFKRGPIFLYHVWCILHCNLKLTIRISVVALFLCLHTEMNIVQRVRDNEWLLEEITVSEVYWRLLNWWRVPLTYCLPWVFIITADETNKKASSFISTERHFYRQLLLRPTVDNTPLLYMWCGKANWFWFI